MRSTIDAAASHSRSLCRRKRKRLTRDCTLTMCAATHTRIEMHKCAQTTHTDNQVALNHQWSILMLANAEEWATHRMCFSLRLQSNERCYTHEWMAASLPLTNRKKNVYTKHGDPIYRRPQNEQRTSATSKKNINTWSSTHFARYVFEFDLCVFGPANVQSQCSRMEIKEQTTPITFTCIRVEARKKSNKKTTDERKTNAQICTNRAASMWWLWRGR